MTLFTFRRASTMIRPATTRVILGFDSSNSLQEVSFVKSAAVTDTEVSIERVNLALYDSYVVTGPIGPTCTPCRRDSRTQSPQTRMETSRGDAAAYDGPV